MPIWLRRHTFLRLQHYKDQEAEAYKKSGKGGKGPTKGKGKTTTDIDLGNLADKAKYKQSITPKSNQTYVSRASKK